MIFEINPIPKNIQMPGGDNPYINANYISTLVNISIIDTTTNITYYFFILTYIAKLTLILHTFQ
jgi:hypothetical protein